jgi:hypothetical protein
MRGSFVHFGVAAVFADPCEGAFDDPAFRQHDEARLSVLENKTDSFLRAAQ